MNTLNKIKGLPAQLRNSSTTVFFMAFSFSASHCTWHYCSIGKPIVNSFHQRKENSRLRNKNLRHRVTVDNMKPNKLVADLLFLNLFEKAGVLAIYTFLKGNKIYTLNYMRVAVAQLICHLCYINPSIIRNRKILRL